jgi:hypothetical protein
MPWWQSIHRFLTPKRRKYPLIAGTALWLTWLVSISFGEGIFDLADQIIGTDYIQFYSAGLTLRLGDVDQLYNFDYQKQLQESIAGTTLDSIHAFITPPFLAWLYLPFSAFPYTISFLLWSAFSLTALWLSFSWLGFEKPARKYLWALSWFPLFASISFGQNSLLSLAILSLTYLFWNSNKKLAAGVVISLLLYKPQLMLGVSLLWLLEWRRDWKALLGLGIGCGVITSLSIWLLPEASQDYLIISRTILPKLLSTEGFPLWHAHTLRAFILLMFPGQVNLSNFFWILLSIIAVFAFIRFWRVYRENRTLLYAGAICLTILITPHAMIYDWVLLLIPAVLIWENKPELQKELVAIFALIWIVAIISGSLTYFQYVWISHAIQISVPALLFTLTFLYFLLMKESHPTNRNYIHQFPQI